MSVNNATLTVFKSEVDAEAAVRKLAQDGYDLRQVSLVGRGLDGAVAIGADLDETARGGAATAGASWGGIRAMLVGSGFFHVPGIGALIVAGPLLTLIVRSMGTMVGPDKLAAMVAGLDELGVPQATILRCQAALKSGKVVVIAEGSAMAMILAREVFRRTPVEMLEQYKRTPPAEQ